MSSIVLCHLIGAASILHIIVLSFVPSIDHKQRYEVMADLLTVISFVMVRRSEGKGKER